MKTKMDSYQQVIEFKNKEIAFISPNKDLFPYRGYNITNSQNLTELKKILKIQNKEYNTYVSIATYSEQPKLPLNPKQHWKQFKEWVTIRDQTITNIDFMLDFDSKPTIKGITQAWKDIQQAKELLQIILGEQTKYLQTYFSGNKGFHILAKCKITTNAQDNINKQLEIAKQLQPLCETLDTSIYDTARLRKLLGSTCYSTTFGKTRIIPICDDTDFNRLLAALEDKDEDWFNQIPLKRLNNIHL